MQPSIKIKAAGWLSEFQAFILRGSVVDLAVGIIIGVAFTGVVDSLVKISSTRSSGC
jgi:large conductance mechanosensitive channel